MRSSTVCFLSSFLLTFLLITGCLIPVPKSAESETKTRLIKGSQETVLAAVEATLVKEGFSITFKDERSGALTAMKSGKVAGDTVSAKTPKGTVIGFGMVLDKLTLRAQTARAAGGGTSLTLTVDSKAWYARNLLDKVFQEVEAAAFMKGGR